jgi:glycosyltransferase involved in cell wall biosynthesis
MRVAIILSRIDQLGPVKVMQNLVNSLNNTDQLKIEVFYFDNYVDQKVKMAVLMERLDRRSFCFSNYDIIHTNGFRPDLFAFMNRKKIRYHISTIHNFVFEDLTFTYNRLISLFFGNVWFFLWKRADKLVCVSKTMKSYYSKWFPISKLEVIYNGIGETYSVILPDDDIIKTIHSFHLKGLKVIGTAGILTKRKGIDQILYLLDMEKELALVVIGSGKELLRLVRLSERLKISDRCLFGGFRDDAVACFSSFDFFVTPSRSEGFGLALMEAVQQKVPLICSDLDVFKELLNPDEVTFFKSGNVKSLSEALKIANETGKKKTELAYTRYLNNYTTGIMTKRYFELYKSA